MQLHFETRAQSTRTLLVSAAGTRHILPILVLITLFVSSVAAQRTARTRSEARLVIQQVLPLNRDNSFAFSQDGKLFGSADCGSGKKGIYEIATGRLIRYFVSPRPEGNDCGESVAFSPNGEWFAVVDGASIRIWNIRTGVLERASDKLDQISSNHGIQSNIYFSGDGKSLYITYLGYLGIYSLTTGAIRGTKIPTFKIEAGSAIADQEIAFLKGRIAPPNRTLGIEAEPSETEDSDSDYRNGIKLIDTKTKTVIGRIANNRLGGSRVMFRPHGIYRIRANQVEDEGGLRLTFKDAKALAISPTQNQVAAIIDKHITLFDLRTGSELRVLGELRIPKNNTDFLDDMELMFSPGGKFLLSRVDSEIQIWNVAMGKIVSTPDFDVYTSNGFSAAFSPNDKYLIIDDEISIGSQDASKAGLPVLDLSTGKIMILPAREEPSSAAFSPDGTRVVLTFSDISAVSVSEASEVWDIATGKLLGKLAGHKLNVVASAFSPDGKLIATVSLDHTVRLWDAITFREIKRFETEETNYSTLEFSPDGKYLLNSTEEGLTDIWRISTGGKLCTLAQFENGDWVVSTPDGRFDTSNLERASGLYWVVSDEPLTPKPVEIFMRQYYEPGLLRRVLSGEEFKQLPSIAEINRVQPNVVIKEVKLAAGSGDSADVTVEVQSVMAAVGSGTTGRTKKNRLSSGVFDLRLFREGQLVAVSTPKDRLAAFINDAPRLVAETKTAGSLINTPEDRAWREANDIFNLKSDNVKLISPDKVQYTFRNIKLPRDGRKEVAFTAYAFNADKVKSTTTQPFKFPTPAAIAKAPKQGRAFVFSIGVNASENPAYSLRYAANDARKMQEIIGARLRADATQYSEVIQIPLISDYGTDKIITENTAQKAIIKGVFSLLAGNEKEVPPEILKQIPNRDKIKAVEPEDTLIITYAGHGYADQAGIFYLLPYDMGKDTQQLTSEILRKSISSDELSLWMQDITAAEMIMIIDACHSSAAVQGDGFKPGPMGSRGLGQLAYDKDMKILSATQANNVALELNSLEQGLLSYALLQDGVINSLADTDKNKQLFAAEWLSFAEKRVPELYREVKDSKRDIFIDGSNVKAGDRSSELVTSEGKQKSSLNLQQPSLFDFKRRSANRALFILP